MCNSGCKWKMRIVPPDRFVWRGVKSNFYPLSLTFASKHAHKHSSTHAHTLIAICTHVCPTAQLYITNIRNVWAKHKRIKCTFDTKRKSLRKIGWGLGNVDIYRQSMLMQFGVIQFSEVILFQVLLDCLQSGSHNTIPSSLGKQVWRMFP